MRWRPLRLMRKRWKAIYLVVGYLLTAVLINLVFFTGFEAAGAVATVVFNSAWIYGATRIFRGEGEEVEPPRPLWRMTGAPLAGFLLGAFFVVLFALSIVTLVAGRAALMDMLLSLMYGVFAALYVSSSVQLRRERRR